MAIIHPAGVIQDGVVTDAFDGNGALQGQLDLFADVAEPGGPAPDFVACFGDTKRSLIALVNLAEHADQGSIAWLAAPERAAAHVPLVIGIKVHADDVQVLGLAAQSGP